MSVSSYLSTYHAALKGRRAERRRRAERGLTLEQRYRPDPLRNSPVHEWAADYLAASHGQIRLLEVACADGFFLSPLIERFPNCRFTGVDSSHENIAAAKRFAGKNADWVAGDYMRLKHGAFDLILCERSLHLFPYQDHDIAAKLASDLAPHGIAAITIPASCACTLIRVRLVRALRRLRSPFLDGFIVHIMRLLRPQLDLATLRDRLPTSTLCLTESTARNSGRRYLWQNSKCMRPFGSWAATFRQRRTH